MAHFVIAGKPDCPQFVHAIHVARYLEENLPNFSVHILQKKTGKWEPWLEQHNYKCNWHHTYSPLIWKELSMRGGLPHYVGGLSEFWEYCYDYYGLESIISAEDVQKLVADNMQYFKEMEKADEESQKHIRHVGIMGSFNPIIKLLLPELLQISELPKSKGMLIQLYDADIDVYETAEYLEEVIEGVSDLVEKDMIQLVDGMEDLLKECELLIILGDLVRNENEPTIDWLAKHMLNMFMLADAINAFAKRNLRVVLAVNGPVCFCGTILIESCTAIRIQNIVAVTSDLGFGPLNFTAEQANVYVEKLGAPPVWGFVGVNQFVDIESSIICSDIYRPYQRVLKNKGGSTLPLGIVQPELRFMAYLINNVDDIHYKAEETREIISKELFRTPHYSKVRAVVNLLQLWYAKEPPDDIISLGICSNGSFGLPTRVVFSQPAILDKSIWVPFKNFPLTEKSRKQIDSLIPPMLDITERLSIGPHSTDSRTSI